MIVKIGIMSDTHYGSLYDQPKNVEHFVKSCEEYGCEAILHCGDMIDGIKMRPYHDHEIYWHTLDEILDGVETVLPDAGIPYYFITGNHDHSVFKVIGADFGRLLSERRKDVRYLGYSSGLVTLPGGIRAMLYHGNGGCGQFHGTRLQKKASYVAERMLNDGRPLPHIFASGHCHTAIVKPNIIGMFCLSVGCFQAPTPHLSSIGLVPEQIAFIVEYSTDDEFRIESLRYFKYHSTGAKSCTEYEMII